MTNSYKTALKTLGISQSDREAMRVLSITAGTFVAEDELQAYEIAQESFGQLGTDVVAIVWPIQEEARDLVYGA